MYILLLTDTSYFLGLTVTNSSSFWVHLHIGGTITSSKSPENIELDIYTLLFRTKRTRLRDKDLRPTFIVLMFSYENFLLPWKWTSGMTIPLREAINTLGRGIALSLLTSTEQLYLNTL